MIVRVSGSGQYELDDAATHHLDDMDRQVTAAVHAGDQDQFHRLLHATIAYIKQHGSPVEASVVVPSDVIVPPEDITLEEARKFFEDEPEAASPLA